jgi:hypothetical protein
VTAALVAALADCVDLLNVVGVVFGPEIREVDYEDGVSMSHRFERVLQAAYDAAPTLSRVELVDCALGEWPRHEGFPR